MHEHFRVDPDVTLDIVSLSSSTWLVRSETAEGPCDDSQRRVLRRGGDHSLRRVEGQ